MEWQAGGEFGRQLFERELAPRVLQGKSSGKKPRSRLEALKLAS